MSLEVQTKPHLPRFDRYHQSRVSKTTIRMMTMTMMMMRKKRKENKDLQVVQELQQDVQMNSNYNSSQTSKCHHSIPPPPHRSQVQSLYRSRESRQ